jgi:hypothetical protein
MAAVSAFRIEPDLLRDILAAVAFLFSDELSEEAYARLADPSDRTFDALSRLVEIRREASRV